MTEQPPEQQPIPSTLRPSQQAVIDYGGGKMGVAAVPGAGKTHTLSHLAASLVEQLADSGTVDEQEVLIVTFTNPAVNAFRSRIARLVQQERGLLPYIGYRVRTLHGLANDIVRMRPGLVGLSENFDILDDRVTSGIIRDLAETWIRTSGEELTPYIDASRFDGMDEIGSVIRRYGSGLIESLTYEVIGLAKDQRWTPDDLQVALQATPNAPPLAHICASLYTDYQRALGFRGAVDFGDLMRLAMEALTLDEDFLTRLQNRWPYILEDEAQDSSQLQNEMLRLLSNNQNWVRVGDPNQAIYTTFTTADSNLLRQFIAEPDTEQRNLPVSGRSSPSIIDLANHLVDWVTTDELIASLNDSFLALNIKPTEDDDPQPNPDDGEIYLDWDPEKNFTPEEEIRRVLISLARWLPENKDQSAAVLVPENSRGFKLIEAIKAYNEEQEDEEQRVKYEELLRSTTRTRDAASRLYTIFEFLAKPTDSRRVARVYSDVYWPMVTGDTEDDAAVLLRGDLSRALRRLNTTEDYLWPGAEGDWLATLEDFSTEAREQLEDFRRQAQYWLEASTALPVDQLVLTLSQQLFDEQVDLALGHKIAVVMGSIAANYPDYRLPQLGQELRAIAENERRFLGFDESSEGYEPREGVVTIATMHAAKGLEWDRVYLMAVNNYSFPADQPGDSYIAEKWFIRDELNLQAEARHMLRLLMDERLEEYVEGEASRRARTEYAAERLRLLYVGITRAKRDLIITWNMGRFWDQGNRNTAAEALVELTGYWQKELQS